MTNLIHGGYRAAGLVLLVLAAIIICSVPVQAAVPVVVFSDNFNDNVLDTTKWTADVAGTSCLFQEQNSRAEFQTNGAGANYWHSYLNSKPILIEGWESIEITGKWTNTGYTSRTHIATVTDLDTPLNTVSIEYSAWGSQMWYYWNGGSSMATVMKPSPDLVPFRLKITRTGFEYYENGVLIKSQVTPSMTNSKRLRLQIGAWEYSGIISQTYIDEIAVGYTESVPPVTFATVMTGSPGPGGWYTAPVTISLSASDPSPGSGVALTQYSLDGSTWSTYAGPVTIGDEGTFAFRYRSVDNAGNTEAAKSLTLKIDRTAPVTTATYSGTSGTNGWYTAPVTVTLAADDGSAGSGVKETLYRIGSGADAVYSVPFELPDEGSTPVSFHSSDNAGNNEAGHTDTVKIDTIPPDLTVTAPLVQDYLQSETITAGFSATDATSGIASVTAAVDGTAVTDGQVLDLTTFTLGSHTFTATATDNAGNTAAVTRTFTVKPVPATVNIDPDTLNLRSQSDKNAVTVYIELAGADVNAIDVSTVTLSYAGISISAQTAPTSVGDADGDGIPDRMVKFGRQDLIRIVVPGDSLTLTVAGTVAGDSFEGSDTIRVIGEAKDKGSAGKK